MGVTSELPKEFPSVQQKDLQPDLGELDIEAFVKSASRVIAPMSPISTFAARNPWMGLEGHSFEHVAGWLKNTRDVEIYPSPSLIHAAKKRGEIDEVFLEMGLQRWLDFHSFDMPREEAERFCREALSLDELPSSLLTSPELKSLAGRVRDWKAIPIETSSTKPLSLHVEHEEGKKVADLLDHHLIKWCKLFLDDSQAGWTMPNREKGFYYSWRKLIPYDPTLSRNDRKVLKDWPEDANTALQEALSALDIPYEKIQDYLESHLLSLPGWAGMMLWRSQQSENEASLLTEYLAVRLSMEWVFIRSYLPLSMESAKEEKTISSLIAAWMHWGDLSIEEWTEMSSFEQKERLNLAYSFHEMTRRKLWLEAWEETHADQLSEQITSKQRVMNQTKPALAQFAFCIDVRSEPFRRQLEQAGPFETFGIAGFFGLPIETSELGSEHKHSSLPVILEPQHKIKESSGDEDFKQYQQRRQVIHSLRHTFKSMKQNMLASLLLPEVSGPWLSLKMLARSFVPRGADSFSRKVKESWLRKPSTELSLHNTKASDTGIPVGFSDEEKVNYARQALQMMGLTKDFAPLVVICGHGSQSTNNPYAAALDCGACGGASGGFNAQVLAALCNLPEVREALSAEGIHIPYETIFTAAEHNTTVDELYWLHVPELSDAAQTAFHRVQEAMPKVTHDVNEERLAKLPYVQTRSKNLKAEAYRLAEDWSEIRPEWGLARNAAFIIGRRELTQHCNLEGRAFLHNYDWKQDKDGDILANIIAGPGTVTQWINLQYYGSTVAPHYYGSGSKTTQTVTANLGVMQGNSSDLLTGLPWQSVMQSDHEVYHSPLRLLIVIEAPNKYIKQLLNEDSDFRKKVQNGWVRLASVDPEGRWENWSKLEKPSTHYQTWNGGKL